MTEPQRKAARKRLWTAICGHRLLGPEQYARVLHSRTKGQGMIIEREGRRLNGAPRKNYEL